MGWQYVEMSPTLELYFHSSHTQYGADRERKQQANVHLLKLANCSTIPPSIPDPDGLVIGSRDHVPPISPNGGFCKGLCLDTITTRPKEHRNQN